MCEWLSRDEWCDVRVLCGGRAFDAHRAVLASVSPFLRRILLSCPVEDTTLIVLPDFDLEALTAVLYYIYNGEVAMPRLKLHKFLDIVKALQIYIDREYLTILSVDAEYNINKCATKNEQAFVLRTENDNSSLVTFRKSQKFHNKDDTDYDMQARNRNERFKSVLGDLQSSSDRQRDYFLRDSFMEPYIRNCGGNGRAGVPAIPSVGYLAATSPLLMNANANGHLSPDNAHLPSSSQACTLQLASKIMYQDNITLTELRRKLSVTNLSDAWIEHAKPTLPTVEIFPISNYEKHTHSDIIHKIYASPMSYSIADSQKLKEKWLWFSNLGNSTEAKWEKPQATPDSSQNKVTILNKALDSPWCPRLPNSFRPFRRKGDSLNTYHSNDDNNNIQVIPSSEKDALSNIHGSHNVAPVSPDKDTTSLSPSHPEPQRSRYVCAECGKNFSQLRNYKYHLSVHRGTREFAASCAVCGKSFNDRGYLSSHMKIHRNRKEYKCSQCPKSFNQRVAYNMHVRIHTGVKPHVCPTCGKAFSRKMLLKQHQRTHSGERPYACPHCEKRFADRSNMTLHLRLHTGNMLLEQHQRTHSGERPYACPHCEKRFADRSNMTLHLRLHTGNMLLQQHQRRTRASGPTPVHTAGSGSQTART